MIPRYQRILFWCLNVAILLMAIFLVHGCQQAREKLTRRANITPIAAPISTSNAKAHLAVANDADGSITLHDRDMPLPVDESSRMRVLLGRLLAEYSYKNSTHPLESGPTVDDVFLLDLPLKSATATSGPITLLKPAASPQPVQQQLSTGGQLAVLNLHGAFADQHPSGIEAESLTINSLLGTIYANFPRVQQVRFLVDGQPRDTLNGHADLTRTYNVTDTVNKGGLTALQGAP